MDAIALFPFRPEAHFFIAEFYEPNNKWKQMKMHTQMGLEYYNEAWEVEDIPGFDTPINRRRTVNMLIHLKPPTL